MKKSILFLFLVFAFSSFSQNQGNFWYFGDHAGLDFSSGTPVFVTGGQTYNMGVCPSCHSEGTSSLSDDQGNLLFYCNGEKIWNRNHQVMPNGNNLLGSLSSSQSSILIPQPGSSRFFYAFTTDGFYINDLQYGFRYSKIDMCLDNGFGDITDQKNVLLLDTVAEKLTAVKHANGTDYWIIVHKYYSDAFYVFGLTASGISVPIVSHVGSVHTNTASTQTSASAIGQMKASPNGQKLALVTANSNDNLAEYFDFNKSTGVVSNMVNIQTAPYYSYYGVSFSPDNSKLYISGLLNISGVLQFNLSAGGGNPDSVIASKTQITSVQGNFFGLQLANNGKIYNAHAPFAGNPYLSVINYPNLAGTACNYVDNFVDLNGHSSSWGMPNFMDSYDYSNTSFNCVTGIKEMNYETGILVFPNPMRTTANVSFDNNNVNALQLLNYSGQVVKTINSISGNSIEIDRKQLDNGLYFLQLLNGSKVVATQKLVIE